MKQPIFRVTDETPVAYEFLSRYQNGVFEMPDNFFRLCAEKNVLTLVDHHCLRSAVRTAKRIPERARFHINVFPSTLLAIPTEHLLSSFPNPIPPQTYCVEISEQQIIGDPSYLLEPVHALRKAGVLIAIDDVGFGNSCLESLILLEPDIIKIDKRCIIGLSGDRARTESLRRYASLAETLHSIGGRGGQTRRDWRSCAISTWGTRRGFWGNRLSDFVIIAQEGAERSLRCSSSWLSRYFIFWSIRGSRSPVQRWSATSPIRCRRSFTTAAENCILSSSTCRTPTRFS